MEIIEWGRVAEADENGFDWSGRSQLWSLFLNLNLKWFRHVVQIELIATVEAHTIAFNLILKICLLLNINPINMEKHVQIYFIEVLECGITSPPPPIQSICTGWPILLLPPTILRTTFYHPMKMKLTKYCIYDFFISLIPSIIDFKGFKWKRWISWEFRVKYTKCLWSCA